MTSRIAHGQPPRSALVRPFYPAIDGLRAVAILLVFGWHYSRAVSDNAFFEWGWIGVNLFFVISGFLITGILVDSLHRHDFFRNFYIRRTLRIFPLYYAFWLFLLVLTPFVHVQWNLSVTAMALYVGNLFKTGTPIFHPDPGLLVYFLHGKRRVLLIDHFWSLCVEEQFYLVWPLIVWLVRSKRRLLELCLLLVVLAPAGRLLYLYTHASASYQIVLYYNTFARADALLLGSALALWLRRSASSLRSMRWLSMIVFIAAVCLLTALRLYEPVPRTLAPFDPVVLTIGNSLIDIASVALLLLALDTRSLLTSMLELRPLVAIGRVSYGLYVYNELFFVPLAPFIRHFNHTFLQRCLYSAGTFLIVFIAATLSFRFIESPFLRLKGRLAPRRGAVEDPPPMRSLI
jgi:peptidoglycan/LPS O-acetylase OafA/YrhL